MAESITRGFVKETDMRVYRMNSAPSITRTSDGRLLCVWVASSHKSGEETHSTEMVAISESVDGGITWADPVPLFSTPGRDHADPNFVWTENSLQVYSTTLTGPLPQAFAQNTTYRRESTDEGRTWGDMVEVTFPFRYVCGKQHNGIRLHDGTLIMGFSYESYAQRTGKYAPSEGAMHVVSGVFRSKDNGKTWTPGQELTVEEGIGLDEPAFVELDDGQLFMLLRNTRAERKLYQTRSRDAGMTWDPAEPSTLTSCSSPAYLLGLQDGAVVVFWNNDPEHRWPLCAALSVDGCRTWSEPKIIANPGAAVAYPSAAELKDGTIVVAHSYRYGNPVVAPWPPTNICYARFGREFLKS